MSILRRLFRIDQPRFNAEPEYNPYLQERVKIAEDELQSASQELRQAVQRIESRARVMNTWSGAMKMVARGEE